MSSSKASSIGGAIVSRGETPISVQRRASKLILPRFRTKHLTKQGWKHRAFLRGPRSRGRILFNGFLQAEEAEQPHLVEQDAPHLGQLQLTVLQALGQVQVISLMGSSMA